MFYLFKERTKGSDYYSLASTVELPKSNMDSATRLVFLLRGYSFWESFLLGSSTVMLRLASIQADNLNGACLADSSPDLVPIKFVCIVYVSS
jgi:hypothetical protein